MESPFPYQVATFHATDNFARLPADAWLAGLPTPAVLELRVAGDEEGVIFGRPWFVALGALPASKPATLQVPAALAQALGLPAVLFVSVRALAPLPRALRVTVQPEDADDWEATELGAADVEARLLQQAVLAQTGSLIPFHPPGGGPPIRLRVLGGVPDAPLLLMHHSTELHVAPVVRGARRATEEEAEEAEEEDEEGWEEEAEGASEEHAWSVDVRAFALPPASLAAAPPPALAAFMQPRAAAAHPGLRVLESSYAALAQAELLQAAGCPDGGVARITLLSGGITHDPEDAAARPRPPRARGACWCAWGRCARASSRPRARSRRCCCCRACRARRWAPRRWRGCASRARLALTWQTCPRRAESACTRWPRLARRRRARRRAARWPPRWLRAASRSPPPPRRRWSRRTAPR